MLKGLIAIQSALKAPKGQQNSFGNYAYRSCEDILTAAKPHLLEANALLILTDEMVMLGDRFYVKAQATYTEPDGQQTVYGWAREAATKKGMDESQITGAASSYARKYALNGLFLIDDTKDADTDEHRHQVDNTPIQVLNAQQIADLDSLVDEVGADKEGFLKFLKVESFDKLPVAKYQAAIKALESKRGST